MFVLLGLVCAAPAAAPAACPLVADWPTVWLPTDGTAAVARPTPVVSERKAAMSAMRHRFIEVSPWKPSSMVAPGKPPERVKSKAAR
jgi:hypothetical protein